MKAASGVACELPGCCASVSSCLLLASQPGRGETHDFTVLFEEDDGDDLRRDESVSNKT